MYVYILLCSDESYYTGVTNCLEMRLEQHEQGVFKTCYTYKRRPLKIVYYELFNGPLSAIAFEKKLKGWSRAKKEALINGKWEDLKELAKCNNETDFQNFDPHTSTLLSITSQRELSDQDAANETNFQNFDSHTSTPFSMTLKKESDHDVANEINFSKTDRQYFDTCSV